MLWFSNAARGSRAVDRDKDGSQKLVGFPGNRRRASIDRRHRPLCESLEERSLLATAGYDYVLNGFSWPSPTVVTWSIAPDGVAWNGGANDLNTVFDARFGAGVWEAQIARAFATWQAVTGINFVEVGDGPYSYDTPGLSEGDARFGDIRIGGFTFADNTTLALTEPPIVGLGGDAPTNGGDIELNTGLGFNIGGTYDLYSVVLHEIGHAIGLGESPNPAEVMYTQYEGVRTSLAAGDIAGAQALYGARTSDAYQSQGLATTMTNAANLSSRITATSQTISSLSIASVGDDEYFQMTAPSWSGSVLDVTATAATSSMLSPSISLYNTTGQLIAQQAGNPSGWESTVTASFSSVVPGATYFVVVTASNGTVFSTGNYQITVNLPAGSPPAAVSSSSPTGSTGGTTPVATSPTPTPNPTPPPAPAPSGPVNDSIDNAMWLGSITKVVVTGSYLGPNANSAFYSFRSARTTTDQIVAAGLTITVLNARNRRVAQGVGIVDLKVTRGSTDTVVISAGNGQAVDGYSVSIAPKTVSLAKKLTRTPAAKTIRKVVLAPRQHLSVESQTAAKAVVAKIASPSSHSSAIGPLDSLDRSPKHLKR